MASLPSKGERNGNIKVMVLLVVTLLGGTEVFGQIEPWTDKQGVPHHGNEVPKPQLRETIIIKVRNAPPFYASARTSPSEVRRLGENYLADLTSSLAQAQLQDKRLQLQEQDNLIGRSGESRITIASAWAEKRAEIHKRMNAPIRSDFLRFEKVVKDRNGGELPAWVKENRDWRTLDKAFARSTKGKK